MRTLQQQDELIATVQKTLSGIQTGRYRHNWVDWTSCNCALFAKSLPGVEEADFDAIFERVKPHGLWSNRRFNIVTEAIGYFFISAPSLTLRDVYLKMDDLEVNVQHLEFLSDPDVLREIGVKKPKLLSGKDYVRYLKVWLAILSKEKQEMLSVIARQQMSELLALTKNKPDRPTRAGHAEQRSSQTSI